MRLAGCRRLIARPLAGVWWRAVRVEHLSRPLGYGHTTTYRGRFTPGQSARPGIPAHYFAEDMLVAALEVEVILGSPLSGQALQAAPTQTAWAYLPITVDLEAVVDLTNDRELAKIGATVQDLTGDWKGYSFRPQPPPQPPYFTPVPTQQLAIALHDLKVEGFLTYSARYPTRKNLIDFPTRLRKTNSVTFTDQAGTVHTPTP
jgi:hypothetical protein